MLTWNASGIAKHRSCGAEVRDSNVAVVMVMINHGIMHTHTHIYICSIVHILGHLATGIFRNKRSTFHES